MNFRLNLISLFFFKVIQKYREKSKVIKTILWEEAMF
jgi:hypothetical protein